MTDPPPPLALDVEAAPPVRPVSLLDLGGMGSPLDPLVALRWPPSTAHLIAIMAAEADAQKVAAARRTAEAAEQAAEAARRTAEATERMAGAAERRAARRKVAIRTAGPSKPADGYAPGEFEWFRQAYGPPLTGEERRAAAVEAAAPRPTAEQAAEPARPAAPTRAKRTPPASERALVSLGAAARMVEGRRADVVRAIEAAGLVMQTPVGARVAVAALREWAASFQASKLAPVVPLRRRGRG